MSLSRLRIELIEELEPPHLADGYDDEGTPANDEKPKPLYAEIIETATLGRGELDQSAESMTFVEGTPYASEDAEFEAEMAKLKSPHINLESFFAHHRGVSRKHARLRLRNKRLTVSDLGSTNGTYVNDEKLEPNVEYPLTPGDILRLGFLSLSVHLDRA